MILIPQAILKSMADNIDNYLKSKAELNFSLLGGDLGSTIFLYYASKYGCCSINISDNSLDNVIQTLKRQKFPNPSYCNGIAGMCTGLLQLENDGFLEGVRESLEVFIPYLHTCMNESFKRNDLDFLHGGIGMAMALQEFALHNSEAHDAIAKTVRYLNKSSSLFENKGIFWKFKDQRSNILSQNLSISHGMSAIVIFLARSYQLLILETDKKLCLELLDPIS